MTASHHTDHEARLQAEAERAAALQEVERLQAQLAIPTACHRDLILWLGRTAPDLLREALAEAGDDDTVLTVTLAELRQEIARADAYRDSATATEAEVASLRAALRETQELGKEMIRLAASGHSASGGIIRVANQIAEGRASHQETGGPEPEAILPPDYEPVSVATGNVAPGLLEELRHLGDEYGPAGVANIAAELAGRGPEATQEEEA